jgi:ferredoxin-nitrate reductase
VYYDRGKGRIARGGDSLGCCPKGAAFAAVNGADRADRIRDPMVRRDGRLVPVDGEEAIRTAARMVLETRARQGARALAVYSTGQLTLESLWVTKRLFQGYLGCNNVGANSEQCLVSNATAHEKVFGNEGSFTTWDDADHAEVIWMQGSNARETFPQFFLKKVMPNRDAVKVVIDPFLTSTAKAVLAQPGGRNVHVRFRSGGDVLFNLAIAGEILRSGREDRAYVDAFVDAASRDEFAGLATSTAMRPDGVASRIALPGSDPAELAETIRAMAGLWATRKVVSHSSMGLNQRTGVDGVASVLNLHLLTGNLGRPGRGHLRVAGQSNAPCEVYLGYNSQLLPYRLRIADPDHREKIAGIWRIPPACIDPRPGIPISHYVREPLGLLLVQGTDFANNFVDLFNWRWKLSLGVKVIAIDCFMNESIERFAHVVIPARSHAEVRGVYIKGDRSLQILEPLWPAPEKAISDVEFILRLQKEIASLLWEEEALAGDPPLDAMLLEGHTSGYFNMRGALRSDLEARLFEEVVKGAQDLGVYNQLQDGAGVSITHERLAREGSIPWDGERRYQARPGDPVPFPGHFRDRTARARFHIPAADTLEVRTLGPGEVHLVTGRGFLGTRDREGLSGVNLYNSGIKTRPITGDDVEADPSLYLSPEQARLHGLADDDLVMIQARGKAIIRTVKISGDVPPGHAFVSFHSQGRLDNRVDSPNRLTDPDHVDRHSLQPRIKDLVVKLQRITREEAEEYRGRLAIVARSY